VFYTFLFTTPVNLRFLIFDLTPIGLVRSVNANPLLVTGIYNLIYAFFVFTPTFFRNAARA